MITGWVRFPWAGSLILKPPSRATSSAPPHPSPTTARSPAETGREPDLGPESQDHRTAQSELLPGGVRVPVPAHELHHGPRRARGQRRTFQQPACRSRTPGRNRRFDLPHRRVYIRLHPGRGAGLMAEYWDRGEYSRCTACQRRSSRTTVRTPLGFSCSCARGSKVAETWRTCTTAVKGSICQKPARCYKIKDYTTKPNVLPVFGRPIEGFSHACHS